MSFHFDWDCISSGAPYITISRLSIGVNKPSITLLGSPEYVAIGFDSDSMTIGIKAFDDTVETETKHKFAERIKDGWVRIGCKDFVKYLSLLSGIEFAPAKKYVATYDQDEKLLYVTLGKDNKGESVGEEEER